MRRALLFLLLPVIAPAAEPAPLVRLGSDRFRQAERVEAIAYSPDGKQLATADKETIYLWDAADGRLLKTIPGHERRKFVALGFNADATALFTVALNESKTAIFYHLDPKSGKTVAAADLMWAGKENFDEPNVCFSPDGTWVASRRGDKREVAVIDTATRKVVWSAPRADDAYHALAFRADSRVLAVGGWDGQIRVVDLKDRRITHQYEICKSAVWHVAFSPDGEDLVASVHAGGDTDVIRFDAATGKEKWKFQTHSAHDLFFTPDAKAIVYFGPARQRDDPYLWHWLDSATGKPVGRTMDTGWLEAALRPDGKVLALGGREGLVSQWDLTTRKRLANGSADPGVPVTDLAFTADGRHVRGWANGWYEWDVMTGKQVRRSPPFDIGASETAVGSSDLKWLVQGSLHFYLVEIGTQNRRLIGIENNRFQFLPDGRVVRSNPDQLTVYDPTSAQLRVPLVKVSAESGTIAGSADGTTAVGVVPAGDTLRGTRWDLSTGKLVGEWIGRLPDPAMMEGSSRWRAELSPDGRVLAVFFDYLAHPGMGFNPIIELHTALFDSRTGRYLSGWWDLHFRADLAFSPDGRTVACYYSSGLGADVREVMTGDRRVRRSNPPVSAASFSATGRTLALATQPGPIALWDLVGKPGRWDSVPPDQVWKHLAAAEAEDAFDTIRHLRHHPAEAIAFLKERVMVPTAPAADWVAGRIKDLDAAQFRDREQATADLAAVGEAIVPELRAALKGATAEARRRLEGLLDKVGKPTPETWRAVRACEALEGIGTREARELLATWAKGPPAATLTREAGESVERLAKRGR